MEEVAHAIHQWVSGVREAFSGPDDFALKYDALEAYRQQIGEREECGPYYLVLPSGEGEFIYDGYGLTRFFDKHRVPGATFVSIEGAAHAIIAAAGTVGDIAELPPVGATICPSCGGTHEGALDRKAWLKAYRASRKARG